MLGFNGFLGALSSGWIGTRVVFHGVVGSLSVEKLLLHFGTKIVLETFRPIGLLRLISNLLIRYGYDYPSGNMAWWNLFGVACETTTCEDYEYLSNNTCLPRTMGCDSGMYQATPPVFSSTNCVNASFVYTPCHVLADMVCRPISTCNASQFQLAPPTATTDR